MQHGPLTEVGWSLTAPAGPDTPTLDGDVTVDVAIVGGGYTGLSTALHLAQRGVSVALVEADEIGQCASGRNGGHCTSTFHYRAGLSLPNVRAKFGDRADALISYWTGLTGLVFGLIDRYQIDCDAVRAPCLHAAHAPSRVAQLEQVAADYAALGKESRVLSQAEITEMTGSPRFYGGWLYGDAGHVNPLAYARGLARAALQEGAKIFTRSPATRLEQDGHRWRVQTARGSLRAERLVLATGATTQGLWPRLDRSFGAMELVVGMTTPLPDAVRRGLLPGNNTLIDTFPEPFGIKYDRDGRLAVMVLNTGGRGRNRDTALRLFDQQLRWFWPEIGPVSWEPHFWRCAIDIRPDLMPRLFDLGDGAVSALGFSGRGIPTATGMGTQLAAYVSGTAQDDLAVPVQGQDYVPPFMRQTLNLLTPYWRRKEIRAMRRDGLVAGPR
jgi:glycine/D-amino acid oxidase-like deaminating enzyme